MTETNHGRLTFSEDITDIITALLLAQKDIKHPKMDKVNPHYKNKYASLTAVIDASKKPLVENDLCVVQSPYATEKGVTVETTLFHKTGQWIRSALDLPVSRQDAQGYGSSITYGRRYTLSAILNLNSEEDDDGNAAAVAKTTSAEKSNVSKITAPQIKLVNTLATKTNTDLQAIKDYYKAKSLKDLTKSQASETIEKLQAKPQAESQDVDPNDIPV